MIIFCILAITHLLQDLIGLNITNASEILKYFTGNNKKKPNLVSLKILKVV